MTELRRKRKEAGLCTECGAPVEEGRTTCERCAAASAERAHKRYVKSRTEKGLAMPGKGAHLRKYEYVAWRGRNVICRGSAAEVGRRFGMSANAVGNYARMGLRRKKDLVFFEREVIE